MLPNQSHKVLAVERLEARSLFSSSLAVPAIITPIEGSGCESMDCAAHAASQQMMQPLIVGMSFVRNIDFMPAANVAMAGALPDGYLADTGGVFASHGDEQYGWSKDLSSKTRSRTHTRIPDSRYGTDILLGSSDRWEMAVPNGLYQVRLVAGDAGYTDSVFKFNVEGQLAMDAKPSGVNYWVERSITVLVSDGKLTISSAPGAVNNKLAFVRISEAQIQTAPELIDWSPGNVALPFHRVENGSVQIGSKLYIMGGFISDYWHVTGSFQVYDFNTGKWTTKGNMPGSQTHFALATDGRYIYKMAGQYGPMFSTKGTNEGWKYDTQSGKWSRIANLPAVRFGGSMDLLDGKLHYWGGDDGTRYSAQSDHWTLDLSNPKAAWQKSTPIPLPGDHLSHAVLNGKIYSIGGEHDHGKSYVQHDFVFEFDPATNQWTRKADMPTPASHFEAATFAYEGKIWAIGGQVDHELLTDETRMYDAETDTWSVNTQLPEQRKGGTVAIWNGKAFYISGDSAKRGKPGDGIPTGSWAFDIPDFSQVMTPYRGVFSAVRLPAGDLLDLLT